MMTPRRCLLLLLVWGSHLTLVHSNNNNNNNVDVDDVSIQESLVTWIRDQGGIFNPKQEFKRKIPGNPASPFGIFASQPIEEGEILTSIPWKSVLTANLDEFDTGLHCHTIRLLAKEMKRLAEGDVSSTYLPYIQYLSSLPPVDIPSTWSPFARRLFQDLIQGGVVPPTDATTYVTEDWLQECHGSIEDIQAAMLVLSRGDDDVLIPIYDLYNHCNGKWFNTKAEVVPNVKHELTASHPIQKGQEIYNSYNHCTQCYNRYINFGTAEIFRDYGFVEQYPQRWIFKRPKIAFDLDVDTESGKLQLTFLDYPPFDDTFSVTQEALGFLEFHSQRIQDFYQEKLEPLIVESKEDGGTSTTIIRPSELENIVQYYEALSRALQMAVQAGRTYDFNFHQDNNDDDDDDDDEEEEEEEEEEIIVVPRVNGVERDDNKLQENRDLDKDEIEDDDDDEDDEWSSDKDCPGGLYVKGRCAADIEKWEEL